MIGKTGLFVSVADSFSLSHQTQGASGKQVTGAKASISVGFKASVPTMAR